MKTPDPFQENQERSFARRPRWFVNLGLVIGLLWTIPALRSAIAQSLQPPVRILPLGDSITYGRGTPGGYRLPLHQMLSNAGYAVDFTGTLSDNTDLALPDGDHEGHPGWRIDQIDAIMSGVLASTDDPDIILLLIGTNDYGQGYDTANATNRLEALVARIATNRPYAKLIVANLTQRNEPYDTQIQTTFNPFVPGIVDRQRALGREVYFTDMRSALSLADTFDTLHPTAAGYQKMATNWFNAITNFLSPLGSTNTPALSHVVSAGLTNITVIFSKPVSDGATNLSNYSLDGGLSILDATIDPITKRDVTLATSAQTPGATYSLSVSNITDRTAAATPMVPASMSFVAFAPGVRGAYSNVAEAADYTLVYSLNIPNAPNFLSTLVYDTDLRNYASNFTRVAYYLELQSNFGPVDYVWISMDAFTTNVNAIGVPTAASGALFQTPVTNMNVSSSVPSLVTGTNLSGGNLEFWPGDYLTANSAGVPGASSAIYDFGDQPTAGNYGSMQVHNATAGQTLFAFNRWGGQGGVPDLGIGNRPGATHTDWTFAQNANGYTVKTLQVFVLPAANTNPPVLAGASAQPGWTNIVLTFSKALDEDATNVSHYAVSGGVTVQRAVLDPLNKLGMTLTTSPQSPATLYTVTVSGVTDRTSAHLAIAPGSTTTFLSAAGSGVFGNVPRARDFTLVYSLNIPILAAFNSTGIPYSVDNRHGVSAFSRVAYYLELQKPGGAPSFVWAEMDPFTSDPGKIGVPDTSSGELFQQSVSNLTVVSSVAGIVNGTNLNGGFIEFWPWGYSQTNAPNVPGANSAVYDWGDRVNVGVSGYGSMQIHNVAAGQTVLAFNGFGGSTISDVDLGIGNNTSTADLDWTGVHNGSTYFVRSLQVFVFPLADTSGPTLVSAVASPDRRHVTVTFSEPLADNAPDLANFSIDGGLVVTGAVLEENLREVRLTTGLQSPNTNYLLTVSGVRDRSVGFNLIAPGSTIAITTPGLPAQITNNVPEAADFKLVCQLDLPVLNARLNLTGTVYDADNRAYTGPFTRVAYYLELATNGGPTNWIYVSCDAFTTDAYKIGVPDLPSGALFQQKVTNMNVFSSVAGIVTGTGITTGSMEFWPWSYSPTTNASIPTGSGTRYDWNDQINKAVFGTEGYGSMQFHNYAANTTGQVLFAYNNWGKAAGGIADLGIGSRAGANDLDWTTANNGPSYVLKNLYVLVLPATDTNGPVITRAAPSIARTNLVVSFNEPLDDSAADPANFAIDGGVSVTAATLQSNLRDIVLATSAQSPGVAYTLTVNGVRDRSASSNLIAINSTVNFTAPAEAPVFARVPEATNYLLVHHLAIPSAAPSYNTTGIVYTADLRGGITQPFNRIAYYLELATNSGGPTNWIFVSCDAFTPSLDRIGVPVLGTGGAFQQKLTNMNVASSVAGIVTGTGLTTGSIEFWPFSYATTTNSGAPAGSGAAYDWNDTVSISGSSQYGAMQIHNYGANTTGQVLFAFNRWGAGFGGAVDIGIGTQPGTTNMDWTFARNGSNWLVKNLYVLVQPTNPPPPAAVVTPPGFVVHPKSRALPTGATATFAAQADGTLPVSYQWRFNGAPLTGQINPWLTLTNLQPTQAGAYDVIAANSGGAVTSLVAALVILAPPMADFVATPNSGFAPLTVSFTNVSTGAGAFNWFFGDGNSGACTHAVNTYIDPGVYTVTLVAFGAGGTNSLIRTNCIVAHAPPAIGLLGANAEDLAFALETIPGITYVLQYKDSMDDPVWLPLQSFPGDGNPLTVTITNALLSVPHRFYRVSAQ